MNLHSKTLLAFSLAANLHITQAQTRPSGDYRISGMVESGTETRWFLPERTGAAYVVKSAKYAAPGLRIGNSARREQLFLRTFTVRGRRYLDTALTVQPLGGVGRVFDVGRRAAFAVAGNPASAAGQEVFCKTGSRTQREMATLTSQLAIRLGNLPTQGTEIEIADQWRTCLGFLLEEMFRKGWLSSGDLPGGAGDVIPRDPGDAGVLGYLQPLPTPPQQLPVHIYRESATRKFESQLWKDEIQPSSASGGGVRPCLDVRVEK